MRDSPKPLRLEQPATYQIIVQGRLDGSWTDGFGGMHINIKKDGGGRIFTSLTGRVRDQAELHGMLARTRDLCLPLVRVRLLRPIADSPDES
ncbi:MAG: hypothetical protein WBM17_12750 [Anaerolineales bacterium]